MTGCILGSIYFTGNALMALFGIISVLLGICLAASENLFINTILTSLAKLGITPSNSPGDFDMADQQHYLHKIVGPNFLSIIMPGLILIVLSIIGIIAMAKLKHVLLIGYIIILTFTILFHIMFMSYYLRHQLQYSADDSRIYTSLTKYSGKESTNEDDKFAAYLMVIFSCCGYLDSEEYVNSTHFPITTNISGIEISGLKYPRWCCKNKGPPSSDDDCPKRFTANNSWIEHPCEKRFVDVTYSTFGTYLYSSILILITAILMLIYAILFIRLVYKWEKNANVGEKIF